MGVKAEKSDDQGMAEDAAEQAEAQPGALPAAVNPYERKPYGEREPEHYDMQAVAMLLNEVGAQLGATEINKLRRMVCVYADQFKGVADC